MFWGIHFKKSHCIIFRWNPPTTLVFAEVWVVAKKSHIPHVVMTKYCICRWEGRVRKNATFQPWPWAELAPICFLAHFFIGTFLTCFLGCSFSTLALSWVGWRQLFYRFEVCAAPPIIWGMRESSILSQISGLCRRFLHKYTIRKIHKYISTQIIWGMRESSILSQISGRIHTF